MTETVTIPKDEYELLKRNLDKKKVHKLSKLAEDNFTEDWDSKEDEIWDTY